MNIYNKTKELIENQYLQDNRPFVITFSGGKDSTLLLHLTLEVILDLKSKGFSLKKFCCCFRYKSGTSHN
jgi:DNA sulfur modification protein DndC